MEAGFSAFAKFGDAKSDTTRITLTNSDKWMKQAGIIDGKAITTTDTGICFNKFKKKTMNFPEFIKYVEELARDKKKDANELKKKLAESGIPGVAKGATTAVASGAVERLTDTTKYTGTHKERFDERGKGKGKAGREDEVDVSGYVTGYKNNDTYDKTH